MKRNALTDYANTLCQMLYSRRMEHDRDLLIALPAGTITVDLLDGSVAHNIAGSLAVTFASDFSLWLHEKLKDHDLSDGFVQTASLSIEIDPSLPHPTDFLGPFDRWRPRCEITTIERQHVGELTELGVFRPSF